MRLRNAINERRALSGNELTNLKRLADRRANLNGYEPTHIAGDDRLHLDDAVLLVDMATTETARQGIVDYLKTRITHDADAKFYLASNPPSRGAGSKDFVENLGAAAIALHGKMTLTDWRTVAQVLIYTRMKPGHSDPMLTGALTKKGVAFVTQLLARDDAAGGMLLEPEARADIQKTLDEQAWAVDMSEKDYRGPGPF
jgi:hypothetical protein